MNVIAGSFNRLLSQKENVSQSEEQLDINYEQPTRNERVKEVVRSLERKSKNLDK